MLPSLLAQRMPVRAVIEETSLKTRDKQMTYYRSETQATTLLAAIPSHRATAWSRID